MSGFLLCSSTGVSIIDSTLAFFLLGLPFVANKHNSAFALVQLPIPQNHESDFLLRLTHVKAHVLYSNPHAVITSKHSLSFGIVTHINKTQSSAAILCIGNSQISL